MHQNQHLLSSPTDSSNFLIFNCQPRINHKQMNRDKKMDELPSMTKLPVPESLPDILIKKQQSSCISFLKQTPLCSRSWAPYTEPAARHRKLESLSKSKDLDLSVYDPNQNYSYFDQTFVDKYWITSGSMSDIVRAVNRNDKKEYAIKMVKKSERTFYISLSHEASCIDMIKPNKNVIKLFYSWKDIFGQLLQLKRIPEHEIWIYFAHSLNGLKYIQQADMIHMDIKSDNILLGYDGMYKIADFGIAFLKNQADIHNEPIEGDSKYLPPEVLNNQITDSTDLYCLGISLFEALFNVVLPTSGPIWWDIRNGIFPTLDYHVSDEIIELVRLLLHKDPEKRPTVFELVKLANIKQYFKIKSLYLLEILNNRLTNEAFPYKCSTPYMSDASHLLRMEYAKMSSINHNKICYNDSQDYGDVSFSLEEDRFYEKNTSNKKRRIFESRPSDTDENIATTTASSSSSNFKKNGRLNFDDSLLDKDDLFF